MPEPPDTLTLSIEEFGRLAVKTLEGHRSSLLSLKALFVPADRYPPGGSGAGSNPGGTPPGGADKLAKAVDECGDALAPVILAIDDLIGFCEEYYIGRRSG